MNTVQGPPSGHHPFPPPCSIENPSKINPVDLPANKDCGNFHLGFAEMHTNPLPERCQFFFSDGRQCRLPAKVFRQDELSPVKKDGPRLCFYHATRKARPPRRPQAREGPASGTDSCPRFTTNHVKSARPHSQHLSPSTSTPTEKREGGGDTRFPAR